MNTRANEIIVRINRNGTITDCILGRARDIPAAIILAERAASRLRLGDGDALYIRESHATPGRLPERAYLIRSY